MTFYIYLNCGVVIDEDNCDYRYDVLYWGLYGIKMFESRKYTVSRVGCTYSAFTEHVPSKWRWQRCSFIAKENFFTWVAIFWSRGSKRFWSEFPSYGWCRKFRSMANYFLSLAWCKVSVCTRGKEEGDQQEASDESTCAVSDSNVAKRMSWSCAAAEETLLKRTYLVHITSVRFHLCKPSIYVIVENHVLMFGNKHWRSKSFIHGSENSHQTFYLKYDSSLYSRIIISLTNNIS